MTTDQRNSNDDCRPPQASDPTAVEPANPFDSTDHVLNADMGTDRHTQLSDPPTGIVRRESFRELPPGSVVDDTYEIDARLGAGAMGEVYAAHHIKLGKRVAIKVIGQRLSEDDAAIERFAMEARTLAQIQHPAIVAVDHVGELTDGRAYFVMEFLRGESLFERLQRGRVPLPEALRILDQMARGLDAAHGEGVTHRDLKPENTFLVHLPGEPPTIKLLDFGLAKLRRTDVDFRAERTQSGVAIGTPMYMSPEQARGPDVDHRTDIYALGCVAYELLLGRAPFPDARTAPELYAAHLHEAPPLPRSIWPEIPTQLDLVLSSMLAKDPNHRPSLEQVRAAIAAASVSTAAQHAATEFVGARARAPRQKKHVIAALTVLAVGGGITIGLGTRGSSNESAAPQKPPVVSPRDPPDPPVAKPNTPPVVRIETPVIVQGSDDPKPAPRQGSASRPRVPRKTPPVIPIDAGVNVKAAEPLVTPPPPDKPKIIDRNQTINPFAKKRSKGNP
jgi:serine/threonine-protein kinase